MKCDGPLVACSGASVSAVNVSPALIFWILLYQDKSITRKQRSDSLPFQIPGNKPLDTIHPLKTPSPRDWCGRILPPRAALLCRLTRDYSCLTPVGIKENESLRWNNSQ